LTFSNVWVNVDRRSRSLNTTWNLVESAHGHFSKKNILNEYFLEEATWWWSLSKIETDRGSSFSKRTPSHTYPTLLRSIPSDHILWVVDGNTRFSSFDAHRSAHLDWLARLNRSRLLWNWTRWRPFSKKSKMSFADDKLPRFRAIESRQIRKDKCRWEDSNMCNYGWQTQLNQLSQISTILAHFELRCLPQSIEDFWIPSVVKKSLFEYMGQDTSQHKSVNRCEQWWSLHRKAEWLNWIF
jgi:hypothetical protein